MAAVSASLVTPARSLFAGFRRRATTGRRAVRCVAAAAVEKDSVSLVLLAGGVGKRMGADMPKQYLPLLGTPIALYSLKKFAEWRAERSWWSATRPTATSRSEVSKPVVFAARQGTRLWQRPPPCARARARRDPRLGASAGGPEGRRGAVDAMEHGGGSRGVVQSQ